MRRLLKRRERVSWSPPPRSQSPRSQQPRSRAFLQLPLEMIVKRLIPLIWTRKCPRRSGRKRARKDESTGGGLRDSNAGRASATIAAKRTISYKQRDEMKNSIFLQQTSSQLLFSGTEEEDEEEDEEDDEDLYEQSGAGKAKSKKSQDTCSKTLLVSLTTKEWT